MEYSEINEKFYIIAPIKRGKNNILVCKSKKDARYNFFILKKNGYDFCDEETEKDLKKIYYNKIADGIHFAPKHKLNKKFYAQMLENEKKNIENFIILLPKEIKEKCVNNMNKIEHVVFTNANQIRNRNLRGYFNSKEKKIYTDGLNSNDRTLLHELLHVASSVKNFKGNQTGVEILIRKNIHNEYGFVFGAGFNEAITELFTCKIKDDKAGNQYNLIVNVVENLFEQTNLEKVKEYYFNSDLHGMIEYLKNEFKFGNDEKIVKLIVQLDTLLNFANMDNENFFIEDENSLIYEIYKNLIDIKLNKIFILEKKRGTFNELIHIDSILPNSKRIFSRVENKIVDYYNFKVLAKFINHGNIDLNGSNIEPFLWKLCKRTFCNKYCNGSIFPEEFKISTIYLILINSIKYARKKFTLRNKADELVEKITIRILNEANQFLPINNKQKYKIYKDFYMCKKLLKFNVEDYIPPRYMGEIVNENKEMGIKLVEDNFDIFAKSIEFMNFQTIKDFGECYFENLRKNKREGKIINAQTYFTRYFNGYQKHLNIDNVEKEMTILKKMFKKHCSELLEQGEFAGVVFEINKFLTEDLKIDEKEKLF